MSDTMSVDVKIGQLTQSQRQLTKRVEELTDLLLSPERGIYNKFYQIESRAQQHEKDIDDIKEDIDKLLDVCTSHERRVNIIEQWASEHKQRHDELHAMLTDVTEALKPLVFDYKVRQRRDKTYAKLLWLIVAAIITTLIPVVKYVVFDARANAKINHGHIEQPRDNRSSSNLHIKKR